MHISALNITCYTVFELQIDTYAWHMAFILVSDIPVLLYLVHQSVRLISHGINEYYFFRTWFQHLLQHKYTLLNHMSIYFALPPMSSDYFPGIPNDMLQ